MLKTEKILLASTGIALLLNVGCFILTEPNKTEEIIKESPKLADALRNPFAPVLMNIRQKTAEETHSAREVINHIADYIPQPPHRPKVKQAYQAIAAHFKTDKEPDTQPTEALAYAAPENPVEKLFGIVRQLAAPTQPPIGTAVYKISDHRVYLPDGTKLEAHSGLGRMRDNPQYTHVRMRGPTPPHIYELSWRERPFHGVKAIRLNPIGGSQAIHNRDGLLAHTYMLNPEGASNGCVSFRDYTPFQRAFERGLIKKLAVIP